MSDPVVRLIKVVHADGVIAHDLLRDEDGFIKKRLRFLIRPV